MSPSSLNRTNEQSVVLGEVNNVRLEHKRLISSSGRAASIDRTVPSAANASNTWMFMNDAEATLYHLWIHYQILKSALCVSLSSLRITDVPIRATCPGGEASSQLSRQRQCIELAARLKSLSPTEGLTGGARPYGGQWMHHRERHSYTGHTSHVLSYSATNNSSLSSTSTMN